MNIYYQPEEYGLKTVGEVEWGDGYYNFDLTVVWQDISTGTLYYADDSGCSCPSPFEIVGRDDLTVIDWPQTFIDHVNERISDLYDWKEPGNERAKGDAGQLVMKVREAI